MPTSPLLEPATLCHPSEALSHATLCSGCPRSLRTGHHSLCQLSATPRPSPKGQSGWSKSRCCPLADITVQGRPLLVLLKMALKLAPWCHLWDLAWNHVPKMASTLPQNTITHTVTLLDPQCSRKPEHTPELQATWAVAPTLWTSFSHLQNGGE